jgi:hypothetical protein
VMADALERSINIRLSEKLFYKIIHFFSEKVWKFKKKL